MTEHGIGTISEIYDGDPPHTARGAVSQAWSVAELLRIHGMIVKYEKK
jgi:glycogen debranching enzyme